MQEWSRQEPDLRRMSPCTPLVASAWPASGRDFSEATFLVAVFNPLCQREHVKTKLHYLRGMLQPIAHTSHEVDLAPLFVDA
jgi:hypothetical protein